MRKIILLLVAFALIAAVATAGCVARDPVVNLDPNKEPDDTRYNFSEGLTLDTYRYDNFTLDEYFIYPRITYLLKIEPGTIQHDDWNRMTDYIVSDIESYHDVKYQDRYSIDRIIVEQKSSTGIYRTLWDPDDPDWLSFWYPDDV